MPLPFGGAINTLCKRCSAEREGWYQEQERVQLAMAKRERVQRFFGMSTVGPAWEKHTFANWKARAGSEAMLRVAKSFSENWPKVRSLLFMGRPGNGKTHLAEAIAHELLGRDYVPAVVNVTELMMRLNATYSGSGEHEAELLSALVQSDCLILDDVGAQKWSEKVEERIYSIIDGRLRGGLPMVITTNLSGFSGLRGFLAERTVDRLWEICEVVQNDATSYRLEIAKKMRRE